MREEKLINRGWQFAFLPCAPIDAKTAKKKNYKENSQGKMFAQSWKTCNLQKLIFHTTGQ